MNKIILALIFVTGSLFAQTGASFKFGDITSWWTPKVFMYGNSTYWHDSSNYQTTNKSVYIHDSLKVGKDLYVGVKGGAIYMDTSRNGSIYFDESDFYIKNTKSINPTMNLIIGHNGLSFVPASLNINTVHNTLMTVDSTSGITLTYGNVVLSSSTGQIKLPSDTATDYDANDAVTLNRQSGKITTKSLTTAADGFYTFTLTNSLISATSKIFLNWTGGTESAGRPTIYKATCGSGSATIILLNLTGAGSFNGTVQLDFVIFN